MRRLILIAVALVFLLGACTNQTPKSSISSETQAVSYKAELKEQSIKPLPKEFTDGINAFGFKAAKQLYSTDENLALSPVSIELALAMTRSGAARQTAKEMASALCLDGMTDAEIIDACKSLMWRANTGGMEAANAIWLGSRYTYRKDFVDTCTNKFMADAMPLKIPEAKDEINAWVNEKTHGKINQILDEELGTDVELILCNALYYLGEWEIPFEANDTYDSNFHIPNGKVSTSFMHSDWYVPYVETENFSMISLPFKSKADEGKYTMAFMLPKEGGSVDDMLSSFDDTSFTDAIGAMEEQEVWIKIPKFEYTFFTQLNDTLKALGMKQAFKYPQADFSPMTEEDNELFISRVLHKCYIRIDELGAEAAAVTLVEEPAGEPLFKEEPPKFYADRPFVFAIYSQEDGAIAFIGAINDPTE